MPITYSRRRTSSGRKSRMPRAGSVLVILESRQRQTLLLLVLARLVGVRHLAVLVALEKEHLRDPFVRIDLRRQRCRVGNLERHEALPLWLERRDVDDEAAPGVGGLTDADREHVAWYPEV